jgi:hypothetical protein
MYTNLLTISTYIQGVSARRTTYTSKSKYIHTRKEGSSRWSRWSTLTSSSSTLTLTLPPARRSPVVTAWCRGRAPVPATCIGACGEPFRKCRWRVMLHDTATCSLRRRPHPLAKERRAANDNHEDKERRETEWPETLATFLAFSNG